MTELPPPAPRPIRPRRVWYVVAVVVLVLGVAAGVGSFLYALSPATGPVQQFDPDHPARVTLSAGDQRTLYAQSSAGTVTCTASPGGLRLSDVTGSLTMSRGGEDWVGRYQMRADRAGTYTVTCTGGQRLAIGSYFSLTRLFVGILGTFVCPGGAFLFAAIVCLVVALRRHSRRKAQRAGVPPPGPTITP